MAGKAGRSGRKPQATALLELRGSVEAAKRASEPRPVVKLPPPPAHLSKAARAEWRRTGKQLAGLRVMTESDAAALAAYCQVYARWVDAEEHLAKEGVLVNEVDQKGRPYWHQSPYLAIANKAIEQMTKLLVEFGMTPASRTRVRTMPKQDADPFEDMLSANRN